MLLLLLSTLSAHAGPIDHALIIGSESPGPGQQSLRYALDDAERVREVFVELGGLPEAQVRLLENPDGDEVRDALAALADEVAPGEGVLVYYSGHARASSLDLGGDSLSLDELDALIDAVPAELTLVVLDACQAGALSQVKGAEPAPGFSVASTQGLDAAGRVVIASSTATELSQESEALQGSYFTHHFVVGLRGAADVNLDGAVSLSEAYDYAYNRTVTTTSSTAVGRQHPTLETELRGRGELVLTRPVAATARLRFSSGDEGEILLVAADSGVVAAEVSKVRGDALVLALPPGPYEVLRTLDGRTERCEQVLTRGQTQDFAPRDCAVVEPEVVAAKGAGLPGSDVETFALELGAGLMGFDDDAYTERLANFGFWQPLFFFEGPHATLSFAWSPARNLALVGVAGTLETAWWERARSGPETDERVDTFRWTTRRYGVMARGQLPLARDWLVPYVQAGGGLGVGYTEWQDADSVANELFFGWHLAAGAGAQLMPTIRGWRHLGLYAQTELVAAPVIKNLLGDTRDSSVVSVSLGLRASL